MALKCEPMKASQLIKSIFAGLAFAVSVLAPALWANVQAFFVGGSVSQSVIHDRATNFFMATRYNAGKASLREIIKNNQ